MAGRDSRWAVVMAGGSGTRFWPLSRQRVPKQFLAVRGRRSLLQETVCRLAGLVARDRVLVVAKRELVGQVRSQLPALPGTNVLVEPDARGTAPCLALAAAWIARRDPAAVMAAFPADHVVTDAGRFRRALETGFRTALAERCLVTFGIVPHRAETGYGYIEVGTRLGRASPPVHWAARFHEKPDAARAEAYLQSGRYLWNSGMFVWRTDVFGEALERLAPDIAAAVGSLGRGSGGRGTLPAAGRRAFRQLAPVSVDVAVMERAEQVAVVRGDFGWSDVGSWAAMPELWGTDAAGNATRGKTLLVDCRDTVAYGGSRLVAVLGAEDLIVVDGPDAVLVCPRSRAQDVRRVVDALARGRHRRLL